MSVAVTVVLCAVLIARTSHVADGSESQCGITSVISARQCVWVVVLTGLIRRPGCALVAKLTANISNKERIVKPDIKDIRDKEAADTTVSMEQARIKNKAEGVVPAYAELEQALRKGKDSK